VTATPTCPATWAGCRPGATNSNASASTHLPSLTRHIGALGGSMPPTVSLSYRSRVRRHHRRRVIEFGTGEMNAHSEPRFLVISRPASYSVSRHWHCSWQCRACTRYGLLPWQCSADSRKRKRAGNGGSDCGRHVYGAARCRFHSRLRNSLQADERCDCGTSAARRCRGGRPKVA
jgi:hypothetical protein